MSSLMEPDAALARRDPAVPGLVTVFDPEAFVTALRHSVPGVDWGKAQITYVKYRPGVNCVVSYRVDMAGAAVELYAKARRGDAPHKRPAIDKQVGAPERIVLADHAVVVSIFPNDRRMKALSCLADAETRKRLLGDLFPDRPDLWKGEVRTLRWKPEWRYVGQLLSHDGPQAALKLYSESRFPAPQSNGQAFASRGSLRVARQLGRSDHHCIVAFEWTTGRLLLDSISGSDPDFEAVAAVGSALATLHAQDSLELACRTGEQEAARLLEVAGLLAFICPHLGQRAQDLARKLAALLVREPATHCPIHNDFHAKQVLLADGCVAFIDFDQAVRADPAIDLGNFVAHLELDAVRGSFPASRVKSLREALLDGYGAASAQTVPARVKLFTAARLLRRAGAPFRAHQPNWPERTEAMLDRVEAILNKVSRPPAHRSSGLVEDGVGKNAPVMLDEDRMKKVFEEHLLRFCDAGTVIQTCHRLWSKYRPLEGTIQAKYQVDFENRTTGRRFGRRLYLVIPGKDRMTDGMPETGVPDDRASAEHGEPRVSYLYLAALDMLIEVFPTDLRLPQLGALTNPVEMTRYLQPYTHRPNGKILKLKVVKYKPEKRSVIQYDFGDGEKSPLGKAYSMMGKTFHDERGSEIFRLMQLLRANLPVPEPICYIPELKLLVTETVVGHKLSSFVRDADFPRYLSAAAEAIAGLHKIPVDRRLVEAASLETVSLEEEADNFAQMVKRFGNDFPSWKQKSESIASIILRKLRECRGERLTFVHGELHPGQLLVSDARIWMVDFDRFRISHPATDVGRFLAYCNRVSFQVHGDAGKLDAMTERFLDEYLSLCPDPRALIPVCHALECLKICFIQCRRRQKPGWELVLQNMWEMAEKALLSVRQ